MCRWGSFQCKFGYRIYLILYVVLLGKLNLVYFSGLALPLVVKTTVPVTEVAGWTETNLLLSHGEIDGPFLQCPLDYAIFMLHITIIFCCVEKLEAWIISLFTSLWIRRRYNSFMFSCNLVICDWHFEKPSSHERQMPHGKR